jgi:GT2 family glycosyltransferase
LDKNFPSLAVVIPTYNRVGLTLSCVRRLNNTLSSNFRIFVCDSDSPDKTAQLIGHEPNVTVIELGNDAWWSAAVNAGVTAALDGGFHLILLLNDDVKIVDNAIQMLMLASSVYPTSILSPTQRYGGREYCGTVFRGALKLPEVLSECSNGTVVSITNGCCLLIPAVVFEKVGYFNQTHCPQLYGDTEFQLRASNWGFATRVVREAIIEQIDKTNYLARMNLRTLFTFPGSSVHFSSYFTFGMRLFAGRQRFLAFGIFHHLRYLRSVFKSICIICLRSFKFNSRVLKSK